MPLLRVRDLARHAARHGYLVASFKVHGAEEAQAVVNAAEAARAPAIIAVDEQGPVLLRHEITLAIAESLAASASVPIAVEVVSPAREHGLISSRTDSVPTLARKAPAAAAGAGALQETEAWDREIWFATPEAAAEQAKAAQAGCRIGLLAGEVGEAGLRPAMLRKQLENLSLHRQITLVVDGDLPWSNATFRSLPGLGVTKVNFDRRLGLLVTKAYRRAAHKAGEHYRAAVEETFTALTEEIVEWLRRAGASGRAADVTACAPEDEPAAARPHAAYDDRGIARLAAVAPRGAAPAMYARRAAWSGGHASFTD
jgi:fructose/tagatose bisphosphate aldolase